MPLNPGYDFVYYTIYREGKEIPPEELPLEQQNTLLDLTNTYAKLLESCECFDHPGSANVLRITWKDHVSVLTLCCCRLRCMQLEFVTKRLASATKQHMIPLELTHPEEREPVNQEALRARFLQWFSSHFGIDVPSNDSSPSSKG